MKPAEITPRGLLRLAVALAAVIVVVGTAAPPRAAHARVLLRSPYLQSATPTSVLIAWRTDDVVAGVVRYGTTPDALDSIATGDGPGTEHVVRLSGLVPATTYWYSVYSDGTLMAGAGDPIHRVHTPPVVGDRGPFRAWVVGDSGTGGGRQRQVRDAMLEFTGADAPDLFLHLGDMAYGDGTDDEFTERFYRVYSDILGNTPVWPTLGNHEGHTSDSLTQTGPYFEGYHLPTGGEAGGVASGTEAYYSFDRSNVHFVVLDSHHSDRAPDGAMLQWLAVDLAATEQEWLVAFWHHPPYTKGSHDSDRESQLIEMRENALPLLEAAGVDLVLAGHSHVYERSFLLDGAYSTPSTADEGILDGADGRLLGDGPYVKQPGLAPRDGAIYIVAGHGGTAVSARDRHPLMAVTDVANGSVLLDFEGAGLKITNLRWDGTVTDRSALVKGTALLVATPDGGEFLQSGEPAPVRWASTGDLGPLRLLFSCDGGAVWSTVAEDIEDDGSVRWIVPNIETDGGLIRLESMVDPSLNDRSSGRFSTGTTGVFPVIAQGDRWRYHDTADDPGADWASPDFNDSGWSEGASELGFGDGDEATVLHTEEPQIASYYFRHEVDLSAPVAGATLTLRYDDGVAVFVNGRSVFEKNVDDGLGHDVPASVGASDNQTEIVELALDPNPFVAGRNVIAVVMKQVAGPTADLSFDLGLAVRWDLPPASRCPTLPAPVEEPGCDGCAASAVGAAGRPAAGLLLLAGLLGWGATRGRRGRRRPSARAAGTA